MVRICDTILQHVDLRVRVTPLDAEKVDDQFDDLRNIVKTYATTFRTASNQTNIDLTRVKATKNVQP